MCQLQPKTFPAHIEFIQLKPNNSSKRIHYLVKHVDVLYTRKTDSHRNSVDYGDDQFTLCIQDKHKTVTNTPLDSFSSQSVYSFLTYIKNLFKK